MMKSSLEVLTWLTLLAQACYVGVVWNGLPYLLPSHLNRGGAPDAYMPRFLLWVLVAVAAFVVTAMGLIQQFPEIFSLPRPPRHPDRPRVEDLARTMFACLRLEVAAIFAMLLWSMVNLASLQGTSFGAAFTALSTLLILLTVLIAVAWMKASPRGKAFIPAAPRAVPARQSVRSTAAVAPVAARPHPSGT